MSPPGAGVGGARRIGGAYSLREQVENLGQQKVLLEWQVEEAARAQAQLEAALSDERSRVVALEVAGAADRENIAALAARLDAFENSGGSNSRAALDMNPSTQSRFCDDSQAAQQGARACIPSGSVADPSDSAAGDENSRLRRELQQSREMLAKYTEELACIMPGMQRLLQDVHAEPPHGAPKRDDVRLRDHASARQQSAGSTTRLRSPGFGRTLQNNHLASKDAQTTKSISTGKARGASPSNRTSSTTASRSIVRPIGVGAPSRGQGSSPQGSRSTGL